MGNFIDFSIGGIIMLGDLWLWIKAQFCNHKYRRVYCDGYVYYRCAKCGRIWKGTSPPYFLDCEIKK